MTVLDPPQAPGGPSPAAVAIAVPAPRRRLALPAWRPWHGRPRARDVLCVAAIAASALYSAAMIPLTPLLIAAHPLLLELLAGSNASVLSAGAFAEVHGTPPAIVVAAALPAMMRSDWVLWWAGRLWGRRIVERLGRHNPRISLAERRGRRFALPLVALAAFLPGGTQSPLYAAAGWLGLPLPLFVLADVIGTTLWVSLLTAFGYLLGGNGVALAGLVSHYAVIAVSVPVLTAVAPHLWRRWRRRGRRAAGRPGEREDEAPAARAAVASRP